MLPTLAKVAQRNEGFVLGTFRKNVRGFGFVEPQVAVREKSIFVPAESTKDALTGDTVKIRLERDERGRGAAGPGWIGDIVEVVKRKRSSFTGELVKRGGQWVVYPDGREITKPIVVQDAQSKNAKEGDKVVVEIIAYPEGDYLAEGAITKVLGDAGKP